MNTNHKILLSALLSAGIGYALYTKYSSMLRGKIANEQSDEDVITKVKKERHAGPLAKLLKQNL